MKHFKYKSHEEYLTSQKTATERKFDPQKSWANEADLDLVANYIKRHCPKADFGICHGVRNGFETAMLRRKLGIEVIGTDLVGLAEQPYVVTWDFHNVPPEWIRKVDFIYSNSFDHSYDPAYCLEKWMECISPQGYCFLQWSVDHDSPEVDAVDCFSATLAEYQEMVSEKHILVETIKMVRIKVTGSGFKRKKQAAMLVIKPKTY